MSALLPTIMSAPIHATRLRVHTHPHAHAPCTANATLISRIRWLTCIPMALMGPVVAAHTRSTPIVYARSLGSIMPSWTWRVTGHKAFDIHYASPTSNVPSPRLVCPVVTKGIRPYALCHNTGIQGLLPRPAWTSCCVRWLRSRPAQRAATSTSWHLAVAGTANPKGSTAHHPRSLADRMVCMISVCSRAGWILLCEVMSLQTAKGRLSTCPSTDLTSLRTSKTQGSRTAFASHCPLCSTRQRQRDASSTAVLTVH